MSKEEIIRRLNEYKDELEADIFALTEIGQSNTFECAEYKGALEGVSYALELLCE